MNNPFRSRGHDDTWRRRDQDDDARSTQNATQWGSGEDRSWRGDDDRTSRSTSQNHGYDSGGRGDWSRGSGYNADREFDQSRGGYGRDQGSRGYGFGSGSSYGGDWSRGQNDFGRDHSRDYGRDAGDYNASRYTRQDYDQYRERGSYNPGPEAQRGDFGRGYGVSGQGRYDSGSNYGSGRTYQGEGYAPGAEVWNDRGPSYSQGRGQSDYEPDYLHWRDQQLSNFDNDYKTWRDERRQKFSSDFDSWRSSRPKVETQAANPLVGDVTEGGTGRGDKVDDKTRN